MKIALPTIDAERSARADEPSALSAPPGTLALVRDLAAVLAEERVSYCQWKGAGASRWRTGSGDIDLLIDHTHADRFLRSVTRLELRRVVPAAGTVPGIESYLGFDASSGRVVHIHVYYRLLIGSPQTELYALPLERALLESASGDVLFPAPSPELELITVTLHRLLSERFSAALLRHRSSRAVPADVARLRELTSPEAVAQLLRRHVPELPYPVFQRCLHALATPHASARRAWLRMRVRRALRAHAVAGTGPGWRQRIARRLPGAAGARAAAAGGKRLARGGLVVALVGGDGAGKSTCARALTAWLSSELATAHFHLGRPPRSLFTLTVGAALRLARGLRSERLEAGFEYAVPHGIAGVLRLLREIAGARDRYRLFERVRNSAGAGMVAVCERYPIPENRLLVGPRRARAPHGAISDPGLLASRVTAARRPLADRLMDFEASYYEQMTEPDVVIVLRLAPELAVQRKPQEPADYVRRRAAVIWETDWSRTRAIVIDAERPLPQVIASLKDVVWRHL